MSETSTDILAAIDAGARDIYDINAWVTDARGGSAPDDLVQELRALTAARTIVPATSPRDPRRSAYQRTEGHTGTIKHPGAGAYPCGCAYVHDAHGTVVPVKDCTR